MCKMILSYLVCVKNYKMANKVMLGIAAQSDDVHDVGKKSCIFQLETHSEHVKQQRFV